MCISPSVCFQGFGDKIVCIRPSVCFQGSGEEEEMDDIVNDPAFLQNVLEGLPGVDPQSEAIQTAMGQLQQQKDNKNKDKDKK